MPYLLTDYIREAAVALLAEGVDRNQLCEVVSSEAGKSPSSRRAWIEIIGIGTVKQSLPSRPPRGGRG